MKPAPDSLEDTRWLQALEHSRRGEVLQEEFLLRELLHQQPSHGPARLRLCELMISREQLEQALAFLDDVTPENDLYADLALTRGQLQWQLGLWTAGIQTLQTLVSHVPQDPVAWLFLGDVLSDAGHYREALRARYKSIRLAQKGGHWLGAESTEPQLLEPVDRKSTRLNSSHRMPSRMPSSA